ncbi:disease resistance RPP13-like protein 4 [Argentina anserina]|uniref:disease resistance RPP13-like protein 4 n=1 Tax=Argentina anserina TaxID=57926 RepID=UPI0021767174|nr:disease resistance RPP13-like protein 4 [Potentilla anserina]
MSRRTLVTTSFKTPYVSLDLVSFLKSRQVTPFQIFNDVIMPDFEGHISKGNLSTNNDENHDIKSKLQAIQNDLIYIGEACKRLQIWEDDVNSAIKELALQSLDDAFKERTSALENSDRTNVLQNKLDRTCSIVSRLKKLVYSPSVKFSSDNLQLSNTPTIGKEQQSLNTEDIEEIYNGLDETLKQCFLCFSVYPEDAVIKKKVLIHWWVGEEFIETLSKEGKTAEETGDEIFKLFVEKSLIQPVYKMRRPGADSCSMKPTTREAVIKLAKKAEFFTAHTNGNPTDELSSSKRSCLVRTVEGSNIRELPFHLSQENIKSIINVSDHNLYFRSKWFSKIRNIKVLQLGRWQSSAEHLIEVEDSEFLKHLKSMRLLRYLSLQGVSRITELPSSICKARNLRILNLNGCSDLEKLPHGIGSLKSLTHLNMHECYLISCMPKGLASLSQLQVLEGFVISKSRFGGHDCKLEDLSKLENLRKLSIRIDIKEAKTAERELDSLETFKNLRSLSISWSYDNSANQNLQRVPSEKQTRMENITTPPSIASDSPLTCVLEKLDLHYFPGSNMPDWLKPKLLGKVKKLYIKGGKLSDFCHSSAKCGQWTNVQMVHLKLLDELQMDWTMLKNRFPNLTYLEIYKCPKLSFDQCDEKGVWKRAD